MRQPAWVSRLQPGHAVTMAERYLAESRRDQLKSHFWTFCSVREYKLFFPDGRAGFTCSVTAAADGSVVLIQFIHKGHLTACTHKHNFRQVSCARSITVQTLTSRAQKPFFFSQSCGLRGVSFEICESGLQKGDAVPLDYDLIYYWHRDA